VDSLDGSTVFEVAPDQIEFQGKTYKEYTKEELIELSK
jgi:hypothetical protein